MMLIPIGAMSRTYYYPEVRPTDNSLFLKMDSIIANTDLHKLLDILQDSAITPLLRHTKFYADSVVDNYRFYRVTREAGASLLNVELGLMYPMKYDYVIKVFANDAERQTGFKLEGPDRWDYSMKTDNRTYLFEEVIESDFEETGGQVGVEEFVGPKYPLILLRQWRMTGWTFPVKNGKLVGAFVAFIFTDAGPNPTWDFFKEEFICPDLYMMEREENGWRIPYK